MTPLPNIAMLLIQPESSALARFVLDEAGGSPTELLLVGSLAMTLLTLLVLAFEQAVLIKNA